MKTVKIKFSPIKIGDTPQLGVQAREEYRRSIEPLNNLKKVIERDVFKQPLSIEEMKNLAKDPREFVLDVKANIALDFEFPKADALFNLRAMGISYEDVDIALSKVSAKTFRYGLTEDGFISLEDEEKRLLDAGFIYTQNERQNERYNALQDICDRINNLGIVHPYGVPGGELMIDRIFEGNLKYLYHEQKFVINPAGILQLSE